MEAIGKNRFFLEIPIREPLISNLEGGFLLWETLINNLENKNLPGD